MGRRIGTKSAFASLLAVLTLWGARSAVSAEVVVVCPTGFQEAIAPWVDYRRQQGLSVRVIPSQADAELLRASIIEVADDSTRYVLLVGDAPVIGQRCDPRWQTPMHYHRSKVTVAWNSTPTIPSDLRYGEFRGDSVPQAAVGRLPVDTPQQLEGLVSRIKSHEASEDFGSWRSEVQLVGGLGGFGLMADRAIESVTRSIVTGVLPTDARTCICYASPGHLFFPTEVPFTEAVLDRYQRGARFWVYAGHGQITELDRVPAGAEGIPVLDSQSVRRLSRPAEGAPIAVMLACYTGALDAAEDSLAEQMLLCEGGPIAVIAGSRVTMPYGNGTTVLGLIDGVFTHQLPRMGDAWLHTLTQMHRETSSDTSTTRIMVDALASLVSPAGTSLVEERREHMLLYNLLGDPTLRLQHPETLAIEVAPGHDRSLPVCVTVTSPLAGTLRICLDRPLGMVSEGDPNETTFACFETTVEQGETIHPMISIPAGVSGPVVVRATVSGQRGWASAAARTILR